MKRDGFVAHLYSGPEKGFTLARAWQQAGGKDSDLLEIDLQRGPAPTCSKATEPMLHCSLQSWKAKSVGRTRSVLRQYPGPGPEAPRPIRRWDGEEFGIQEATPEEKNKLKEDDVLLWRRVFLGMVATYLRAARQEIHQGGHLSRYFLAGAFT